MSQQANPLAAVSCQQASSTTAEEDEPNEGNRRAGEELMPRPSGNAAKKTNLQVPNHESSAYGRPFWCSYISNTALMVAVSMLFRYADFVAILGGKEFVLGCVVGVGVSGAVIMRIFQGVAIDRYGARAIWVGSMTLLVLSLLSHLAIRRLDASVYLARMAYATSLAGAAGASITFVSLRSPPGRTAEMIGALGSSGFIGMAVGPTIADLVFRGETVSRQRVDLMFCTASAIALVSLAAAIMAVSGHDKPRIRKKRQPPVWWLVRRYYPGRVLIASVAMGMGIGIPFTFVRTYADEVSITHIGHFFFVYSATAFSMRVFARTLPDRWGTRRTILLGSFFLCAGMLSFLIAVDQWTMLVPAVLTGVGHAFVFPAAVTGGCLAFPARYRGLATAVMLTMFDLGNLVGQPTVGGLLLAARRAGLPAYPTMFSLVTLILVLAGVYYGCEPPRKPRSARIARRPEHWSIPTRATPADDEGRVGS
jgi:MFS family permease